MSRHLEQLLQRYPPLNPCRESIEWAFQCLQSVFLADGKLLICGNGGSCADAGHIAGELMKSFVRPRPLEAGVRKRLVAVDPEHGEAMAGKLQRGLPAVALSGSDALATAIANDIDADLVFAQQVLGLGRSEDALLAMSTSGNSRNVCRAVTVAKALGMKTLGMSGGTGGWLANHCDVCICVPGQSVPLIQELHLPVYHCLCSMLEDAFFRAGDSG